MRSSNSRCRSLVFAVLSAAKHDVLDEFPCLEGEGGSWGGEDATELCDLAGHQAIDGPSDAAFQQAEARRVLELLLQPAQPLRGFVHQAVGLPPRRLGRAFRLLLRSLVPG